MYVCPVLIRFGTGTLTKVFVDRVFQECLTYDGEVVCLMSVVIDSHHN